jgi:hypothetical protein
VQGVSKEYVLMPIVFAHAHILLAYQEPFPLYPGESLVGSIRPLPVVPAEHALHLRCEADVTIGG